MAVLKKSEIEAMTDAQKAVKITELEKAMLELRGEGRKDRVRPLRKAIAQLKTPRQKRKKGHEAKK